MNVFYLFNKQLIGIILSLFVSAGLNAQTSNWDWTISVNGPSDEDEIDAVASDLQGNVYISGKFEDSIHISGYSGLMTSQGMADIMLVKYDSLGILQWARRYGNSGEDNAFDADCDPNGNVVLSGYFQDSLKIDTVILVSKGGFDAFLAKIAPNGDVVWAFQYGGLGDEGGNEVAIGNNGQIIVGAQSKGNLVIGSTAFTNPNPGYDDGYILSVGADGVIDWVRTISGIGSCRVKSIAIDSLGNVYGGGDFISFTYLEDEIGNPHPFSSNGGRDAYVTSWDTAGNLRWFKTWGGSGDEMCKGIATSTNQSVYLTGPFTSTVDFEGDTLHANGIQHFYIWKTNTNGVPEWLRHFSSSKDILFGGELETNGKGGVIMGIGLQSALQLETNNGFTTYNPPTLGAVNPFFIAYDKTGTIAFTQFADDNSNGYGTFGEIARSGRRVFLDVVFRGDLRFNTIISSGSSSNKDGGLVSFILPPLSTNNIPEENEKEIIIFPNPVHNTLKINYSKGTFTVFIYDLQGQLRWKKANLTKNDQINCSFLQKASYFLKIVTKDAVYTELLIKN